MIYDFLIIDGPYLAHRSMDAPFKLTTSKGLDSTMIFVFLRSIRSYKRKTQSSKVVIAWESPKTKQWRKNAFHEYKQNRGFLSQSFINQIKDLQTILHHLNITQYMSSGNEADDVIASFIEKNKTKKSIIFTKDKDFIQLINDNCHMFDGKIINDSSTINQKYGLQPKQFLDLYSIIGDKSDNIPGVNGYGIKKTTKLLIKYKTIDNIPIDTFTDTEWSIIKRNKKLISLNNTCELQQVSNGKSTINEILDKYELKSIKENITDFIL